MAEVAQADLAQAMPALEAAITALEALNKKDITEIKSYGQPPHLVRKVGFNDLPGRGELCLKKTVSWP